MNFTPELIDALATEGLNVTTAARGETSYEYDITGYRRTPRRNTPRGTFRTWSPAAQVMKAVSPHPDCALDRAYQIRLGGVERGAIYTADAIGQLLRENNILHCDGPGNGKFESAMIARKFGLWLTTEARSWDVKLPVTKKQLADYEIQWDAQARYMRDCCERLGAAVGLDLIGDPNIMWVSLLSADVQPFDVFLERALESYDEVNADFRDEHGFDLPLDPVVDSPQKEARRARFWEYVRRRYSEAASAQNKILRKYVRGQIVGNLEFDTEPDYALWGEAYDVPGFNFRTSLFDDEIGYHYWVGYGTKLTADLTHRAPLISVRTNQVAAGPRIIPSREATRYWYGQAVRSGAGGFYLWIKDFPGDTREPNGYFGPCMANPDESTHPMERWETHLEISKLLGETRVFQPPAAETGILVSMPSCAAGGWPDVFSAYVETARAGVFARFISSAELRGSSDPLAGLRLLLVPYAAFEHRSVIHRLRDAVEHGLMLIIGNGGCFQWDEDGQPNVDGRALLGIESISARSVIEEIRVESQGQSFALAFYRPGFSLDPLPGARVTARFADSSAAVVENAIGAGKVVTMGAPILDLYSAGVRELKNERTKRYELLKHWRSESGAADHSWVFDVNLDNIREVTGGIEPQRPPLDPSVQFAPFLYVHGSTA